MQEMPMLRQELNNLKACQFAFLTTAFTTTGLMLGFFPKLLESSLSWIGFLTPLVVILPASCFFFDKARTVTRIVGYYRHLERLVNSSSFPSWENALSLSRTEFTAIGAKKERFIRVMLMRQPHGYWSLAYYTFTALSILCLGGAWRLAFAPAHVSYFRWMVIIAASILVVACVCRNLYLIWQLTVGESSYEANFENWRQRLGLACDQNP
jgi:hypothetical protein